MQVIWSVAGESKLGPRTDKMTTAYGLKHLSIFQLLEAARYILETSLKQLLFQSHTLQ